MKKPNLNPEQEAVVLHHKGPLRVGAVAGSGKTTALVERVATLINKHGVHPNKILMISFSRAAKEEMKRRIDKRIPGLKAGKCVSTFHSIGLRIWQSEGDPDRLFELDTSGWMWVRATADAYKTMGMEPEKKTITKFASLAKNRLLGTDPTLRRLGRIDPRLKDLASEVVTQASDCHLEKHELLEAYFRAENIREQNGIDYKGRSGVRFVTFDDMIYQSAMLLRKKAVLERWARRWSYILQDEAQDECSAQAAIASALASAHGNYMVVGDPAQSVYAFRGSAPEHMLEFDKKWPSSKTIVMFRNYRSGIDIVDVANKLMDAMPAHTVITDETGYAAAMRSERQTRAHVSAHKFADSMAEAEAVAMNIEAHRNDGVKYGEQAVLLRMNRMTRDIEVELAKRSIPYKLQSGQSFFMMKEARCIFGYLAVMLNRASKDQFKDCINTPSRKLGRAFTAKVIEGHDMVQKDWVKSVSKVVSKVKPWQARVAGEWMSFIKIHQKAARDMSPESFAKMLCEKLDLYNYFVKDKDDDESDDSTSANLDAVLDFVTHFDDTTELMKVVESVHKHRAASARKNAVVISTVHKSKGGEWETVYLLHAHDGAFPSTMADLGEERRCFYVACTRAKDELWISRCITNSFGKGTAISGFTIEAGIEEEDGAESYPLGRRVDLIKVGTQRSLGL